MVKMFSDIKTFDEDKLKEAMLEADEGTLFLIGEKRIKNPEGDDSVELTFAQIIKTKDTNQTLNHSI